MNTFHSRLAAALAGRYTIDRELGRGGMATVYLAQDIKHRRQVAIKVLKPELAESMGSDRFLAEIEIAARLNHSHILTLIDSGEADGFLYYVMPFVEGESLRERLDREGELPIDDVARILEQVIDALAYAHRQGVVHRDIKPENVMLDGRQALVMDFGIAKALSEAAGRQGITSTGIALGTPAYMAPEQAAADSNLDHRADIYAVGVLGYELLAGRPPFDGRSGQAVLAAHVTETPQAVTVSRPNTPVALADLVAKSLEKKPADRWQSAEEMLAQVDGLRTSTSAVTRLASPTRRWRRWGVAAAAVAAVVVAGWLAARRSSGSSRPVDINNRIAVLAFANAGATDENYFSDGIARDLSTQLAKLGSFQVVAHGAARQFSGNDVSYDIIGRTLEANYLVEGSVRRSGNSVRVTVSLIDPQNSTEVWSDLYDRELTAEEYFSIQSDIVGRIAEALQLAVTPDERVALAERPTEDIEAYNAYLQGRHHFSLFTGLADDRLAGQYLIHAIERDSTFALAYAALADLLAARGAAVGQESSTILELRGLEADDVGWPTAVSFEPARRLALKALLLDSTLAQPHTTLGAIHFWHDWDWAAAGREFEEAIARSPDVAQGHQWYAEWLMAMNMPDSAVAEARLATELDPGSPVVHWSLVRMLTMARRYDEAKRVALRVVESGEDPLMAMELAKIYILDGSVDSAVTWILEGLRRFGMPQHMLARQEALLDSIGVAAIAADLPPDPTVLSDEEFLRQITSGTMGYTLAGRHEQVLVVIERAHRLGILSKTIPDVVRGPLMDPLRADPRFKAILADMGLPDITED